MKVNIYLLGALLLLALGCDRADDADFEVPVPEGPHFSTDTPADMKIKELYDKYGVYVQYDFDTLDYIWDWSNKERTQMVLAKKEYVGQVIEALEKEVFAVLPEEIVKHYVPLNVFLVDSLVNTYYDVLEDEGVNESLYTLANTNYIVLALCGEGFADRDEQECRERWLSIFIEKIMGRLDYPTEFAAVSTSIVNDDGTAYDQSRYGTFDIIEDGAILKRPRAGLLIDGGWLLSYMTQYNGRTTVLQDFGDYTAFIVCRTSAEKAKMYRRNPDIEKKVELVKRYYKEKLNIVLPEPQE